MTLDYHMAGMPDEFFPDFASLDMTNIMQARGQNWLRTGESFVWRNFFLLGTTYLHQENLKFAQRAFTLALASYPPDQTFPELHLPLAAADSCLADWDGLAREAARLLDSVVRIENPLPLDRGHASARYWRLMSAGIILFAAAYVMGTGRIKELLPEKMTISKANETIALKLYQQYWQTSFLNQFLEFHPQNGDEKAILDIFEHISFTIKELLVGCRELSRYFKQDSYFPASSRQKLLEIFETLAKRTIPACLRPWPRAGS